MPAFDSPGARKDNRPRLIARALSIGRTLGLLLLLAATPADAQPIHEYLRLIAPAAPGGGWDQTARAMQAALQEAGIVQTSSVENIPGAAGTIGLARFISAERGKGDVLMVSGLIMLGAVVTHQSPVTLRQVTPIARLSGEYEVIAVPSGSPLGTLADLVAAFRAAPESISWGGGSAGGTDEILAGLFADAIGVEPRRVNYIAYSGGGESLSAILGGQVSVGVNGLAELAPHIAAGTIRVLAISSAERLPGLDAPTFREQGVDVEIENWRSVVAPPGITVAERQRMERTIEAMVRSEPWKAALERYPLERSLPHRDRVRPLHGGRGGAGRRHPRPAGHRSGGDRHGDGRHRALSALRPRRARRHGVTFLRRHRARMAARRRRRPRRFWPAAGAR